MYSLSLNLIIIWLYIACAFLEQIYCLLFGMLWWFSNAMTRNFRHCSCCCKQAISIEENKQKQNLQNDCYIYRETSANCAKWSSDQRFIDHKCIVGVVFEKTCHLPRRIGSCFIDDNITFISPSHMSVSDTAMCEGKRMKKDCMTWEVWLRA